MDPYSVSFGFGDRLSWGWKVSDFNNGTLQGGVHALAIIYKEKIIKTANSDKILDLIKSILLATDKIRAKNGSMIEAYPRESSFCVTALVAFDLLSAIDILDHELSDDFKKTALDIIAPMINFISENDEEHAIISNHLATGVAACVKWNKLTGQNNTRYLELLEIIYENQSSEGWYKEYEGADPGYQTLCTYYLAAAYLDCKNEKLLQSLKNSAKFLRHFVHIDGTIGGLYGSRNTEVYYPGGIIALAGEIEDFASIAKVMHEGIRQGNNLQPENIDIGNYIPLLNSYAFASDQFQKHQQTIEQSKAIALEEEITFHQTGIFIKNTPSYQAIINYKKGGTIKVFDKSTHKIDIEDGGYFARLKNGKTVTTQMLTSQNFENHEIATKFFYVNESNPSIYTTIVLRVLALTIFKSLTLGNLFKKMIVNMLMTGKLPAGGQMNRSFRFEENNIFITDQVAPPKGTLECNRGKKAKAIHMASSGYFIKQLWQMPNESNIVKYQ